jgi:tetratricopeptide (TPR) repeat protein
MKRFPGRFDAFRKSLTGKKLALSFLLVAALVLLVLLSAAKWLSANRCSEAKKLIDKGDYAQALKASDQAIQLNPFSAQAHGLRGKVQAKLAQWNSALRSLNKSLSLEKTNDTLLERAAIYGQLNEYDLAIADYSKALETSANPSQARARRGAIYCRQKRFDLAAEDYSRALTLSPRNAELLYDRAYCFGQMGFFGKAQRDIDLAISIDNLPKYHLRKGWCLQQDGAYDLAQNEFNRVIKSGADLSEGYLYRGFLDLSRSDYKAARIDFGKARLANPQDARVYIGLAQTEEFLGGKAKAIQYWQLVTELDPQFKVEGLVHMANLQAENDPQLAIKLLEQATKERPDDIDLLNRLAKEYEAGGNLKKAIECLSESISKSPDAAKSYALRGNLYAKLGLQILACEDFLSALHRNPHSYDAFFLRGLMELERHEYAPAESDFRSALMVKKDSPEALQRLAQTISRRNADSAVQTLTIVEEKDSTQLPESIRRETDINKLLDSGYREMITGHDGSAIEVLSDAVKKHPADPRPRKYLAYAYLQKNFLEAAVHQFETLEKMGYGDSQDAIALANTYLAEDRLGDAVSVLEKADSKQPHNKPVETLLEQAMQAFRSQNGRITIATRMGVVVAPDLISALRQANFSNERSETKAAQEDVSPPPGADTSRPKIGG